MAFVGGLPVSLISVFWTLRKDEDRRKIYAAAFQEWTSVRPAKSPNQQGH